MLRRFTLLAAAALVLGACSDGDSGDERQVLVDYSPDDVAVFVAKDFPEKVAVQPGQTIAFKQTWTGEPHTVTGGTAISDSLDKGTKWFALFDGYTALVEQNHSLVNPEDPGAATFAEFATRLKAAKPAKDREAVLRSWRILRADYPELPDIDNPPAVPFSEVGKDIDRLSESSFDALVFATDDDDNVNQNVAHPCYLKTGLPPEDVNDSCTAAQRRQPAFDGTQSFFNSGVLPYEGPRGNTFRMKIAEQTKPGTYFFYCAVHGPDQRVEVDVVKPGAKVPSAQAVARDGRDEAEKTVAPLVRTFRDAREDNKLTYHGDKFSGPFAGLPSDIHASVNEFVPRSIQAKAGEAITWTMFGRHTISFDVPPYLPILELSSQRIRYNPKVKQVAGGAPEVPKQRGEGGGPDEGGGPVKFDAGTYSGKGFWSSGLTGADPYLEYTVRIAKPGTYNYACLVHPQMIGQIVVG